MDGVRKAEEPPGGRAGFSSEDFVGGFLGKLDGDTPSHLYLLGSHRVFFGMLGMLG